MMYGTQVLNNIQLQLMYYIFTYYTGYIFQKEILGGQKMSKTQMLQQLVLRQHRVQMSKAELCYNACSISLAISDTKLHKQSYSICYNNLQHSCSKSYWFSLLLQSFLYTSYLSRQFLRFFHQSSVSKLKTIDLFYFSLHFIFLFLFLSSNLES